ncbi:hypothetical protein ACQ4PT_037342 [Festuca glaucescens]
MELEEGNHEAQQSGTSMLISGATRTGPVLSPSLINRSRAYLAWSARDTQMGDLEADDADEQDVDYEEEEEEDEDNDDEDEAEEDFADEEEGDEDVDMGTFSEQGRNFLSKVWREYEPKRVDGIVIAAECRHCARNICAERKHGTSSLRKHLKRCKERKKVLRVSSQLSASIISPDGVSIGHWTFDQALARRELMRMIVLHELAFSLVEYDGFRSSQTRNEKFEEIVEQVGISCGKWPSLDTPTRWNSTYIMIDIAREYRAVFSSLAIQDNNYPFNRSSEDWENADAICRLLKVFYEATNVVLGTKYPTANLYFHEIWKVKHTLEHQHYEENSKFGDVVMYMKRKLKRYWKLSWLNLCILVILDPQFKLRYIKFRFCSEFADEAEAMIAKVENLFQGMFKEYLQLNGSNSNPMTQGGDDEMVVSDDPMADWDNHITQSAQSTNVDSSELDSYLSKLILSIAWLQFMT